MTNEPASAGGGVPPRAAASARASVVAVAALRDPLRSAIYDLMANHAEPVTRDFVADELQVPRSTAAFHLDRLVASGLVNAAYSKPAGRGGPGSGRPAKLYSLAPDEVAVTLPARRYDLMGDLLASAIEQSTREGEPVLDALLAKSSDAGRSAGLTSESFDAVLDAAGYHPSDSPEGTVMMNCPFHRLAASHPEVICAANHAFLCGAAETTGRDPADVQLAPGAGRCCVRIV